MKKNKKNAKVITVSSSKGGTGKTFFAINLAGVYASLGYKTLIIDTDLGSGGVALSLNAGVNKDIYVLSEDIKNNSFSKIDDYVHDYNSNLKVLAAPIDPRKISKFSCQYLDIVLQKVKEDFDVIVLDTNHILDDLNITALDKSDKNIFVINKDAIGVKNLKSLISIFKDLDHNNYKTVMFDSLYKGKYKLKEMDIKSIIESDIDYILGNNCFFKNYDSYIIKGQIPALVKRNKALYKTISKIAIDIIENKVGE